MSMTKRFLEEEIEKYIEEHPETNEDEALLIITGQVEAGGQ